VEFDDFLISGEDTDANEFICPVRLGWNYVIRIAAKKKFERSDWNEMAAGSYDPDQGAGGQPTQAYISPYLATLPDLLTDGTGVTLSASPFGFNVLVAGWLDSEDLTAHEFEVVYTTQGSLDWNDLTNTSRIVTANRALSIATNDTRQYLVGVRPLQNKQVVGTAVSSNVTSGAGGNAPGDQVVAQFDVNLRTYSGTMANGIVFDHKLTSLKSPSGTGATASNAAMINYLQAATSAGGSSPVLIDSAGNPFLIEHELGEVSGAVEIMLTNLSGNSYTPANGAFTINTTKRGRRLYRAVGMVQEYNITGIYVDVDSSLGADAGDPTVIRTYQDTVAGEPLFDSAAVYSSDTGVQQDISVAIINDNGGLNMTVDAWDDDDTLPNNTSCVVGRITVYGRTRYVRSKAAAQGLD
jgi:hypothetical protein